MALRAGKVGWGSAGSGDLRPPQPGKRLVCMSALQEAAAQPCNNALLTAVLTVPDKPR